MQDNKNITDALKLISVFLIIMSVFMVFKTIGAYKENKYIGQDIIGRTMYFTGEGEVFAVADIATFSFSAIGEGETPADAQNMSAEKVNQAVDYLKENGVEEKDIKTTDYNLSPRYEWKNNPDVSCYGTGCPQSRVLIGYEVTQTISVKVRETSKAGEYLAGIGSFGLDNISSINFSIDDEDGLQREARKLAIEDAKNKAEELSKDLGVKLVRIVNFSESGAYPYATKAAVYGIGGGAMEDAIVPQIPVGENKISSSVTITYEIK